MTERQWSTAQRYEIAINKIRRHADLATPEEALEDAIELCGELWAQIPEKNKDSALLATEEMQEELEL